MRVKLDINHPGFTSSIMNSDFAYIEQFLNYFPLKRKVSFIGEANEMRTELNMGQRQIKNVINVDAGGVVTLKDTPFDFINWGTGLNLSQSMLEVLHSPPSDLRISQSILEVLSSPPSNLLVSQSILEVLHT